MIAICNSFHLPPARSHRHSGGGVLGMTHHSYRAATARERSSASNPRVLAEDYSE